MDKLIFSSMLREHTKWHSLQQSISLNQGIQITGKTFKVDEPALID